MFLPSTNAEQLEVVYSILSLIEQRDSFKTMEETSTILVLRKLMESVISDSCTYVSCYWVFIIWNVVFTVFFFFLIAYRYTK